jgi:hypothetical protein
MKRGRAETSAKTFAGSKKTPERRPNSFMTWNYVRVGGRNGRAPEDASAASMPGASCYTKSVSNFDLQVRLRAMKKDHAETYISAK